MIVGRDAELAVLGAVTDDACLVRGRALVLRGEAGIGKSVLLREVAGLAASRGMRVLKTSGVQAEVRIPYAGLHGLLYSLPAAGAGALLSSPDVSPYLVATTLLDLLGREDLGGPVLVAVDDAHWLDEPTWKALTVVARRLESDPIAMVLTVRDGTVADERLASAGLPELRLEALGPDDSRQVLEQAVPGLTRELSERVLAETAGNPLGLVELGGAAARAGSRALLPASLPLESRVRRTFSALVDELPPGTRTLLLVAALNDGDDLDETVAAAGLVDGATVSRDDVAAAVSARLVTIDERSRVQFRHPLLRSALHGSAGAARRRRVHMSLAATVAGDPDRRVWHRAAAADGPDEALARELTAMAQRPGRHHAAGTALAAFEHAARLSKDPGTRGRRLIDAVMAAVELGDNAAIARILGEVRDDDLEPPARAWAVMMREDFTGAAWTGNDRLHYIADQIAAINRGGEPDWALETLFTFALRVQWSRPDDAMVAHFLEVADGIEAAEDDPRLINAVAQVAPIDRGAALLDRLHVLARRAGFTPYDTYVLADTASALRASPLAARLYQVAADGLRAQGRVGTLTIVLVAWGYNLITQGDARAGLPLVAEGERLAAEIGLGSWQVTGGLAAALAYALQGDLPAAQKSADAGETTLTAAGMHSFLCMVRMARGVAALAGGRPAEALRELARMFDPDDVSFHATLGFLMVGHLSEAAVQSGALPELRAMVDALEPIAARSRNAALLAGMVHARAVLAGTAEAFEAGLASPDLDGWPFERARLQSTYGSWLRRRRRPAESRLLLHAAAVAFDALGAGPWAGRARTELQATGESLRRLDDATQRLTPQETQIARLAAEGLSNRDIALRLFLSPRTVATHLQRAFPKLGITSRAELAAALDGDPD